jgi:hypothetical protein
MCADCGHGLEVTLRADQWQEPAPVCPVCEAHEMDQEFRPVAIGGSHRAKAVAIAEDIIDKDYGVADFKAEGREGGRAKVRYKDATVSNPSNWITVDGNAQFATAAALGRQTRQQFGDGLDVLQANLRSGAQPDLIEVSKRRSMKVW